MSIQTKSVIVGSLLTCVIFTLTFFAISYSASQQSDHNLETLPIVSQSLRFEG